MPTNHLEHKSNQTQHELDGLYPVAETVEDFTKNLRAVQARIEAACLRVQRESASVRLLPVSKTFSQAAIRLAHAAGITLVGENKIQEAYEKWQGMRDLDRLQWAVIGHLQRNKARLVAQFATEFHALDSLRIAEALDRRLQALGRGLDVYVQVNTSEESNKYGLEPSAVLPLLRQLPAFSSLRVQGLMTLAMFTTDGERVRGCFKRLRTLQAQLQQEVADPATLSELSMGMSGDYEIAIEEGATIVRVGQAIFGARSVPNSYYWPDADRVNVTTS